MPKKLSKAQKEHEIRKLLYGKHADEPMYRTVHAIHGTIVCHCDYCGKPMTASDRNDYGSLCETCYMKEYYGQ